MFCHTFGTKDKKCKYMNIKVQPTWSPGPPPAQAPAFRLGGARTSLLGTGFPAASSTALERAGHSVTAFLKQFLITFD